MKETFESLSDSDKALASSRGRGDYIINSALEWIARFHAEFPGPLISRLLDGIRILSRAMHRRSADEIEGAITSLLEVQTAIMLPGSRSQSAPESDRAKANLPAPETPRVHKEWYMRRSFSGANYEEEAPPRPGGSVFISYARADSAWLTRLLIHLRPLERAGRIELWHDGKISAGKLWRAEVDTALQKASAAILVVTANFMASDFIYSDELPPLARRAREGGVAIFPVVFGHCLFEEDQYLKDFQLFNDPELPLSRLEPAEADGILVKLAKSVMERG